MKVVVSRVGSATVLVNGKLVGAIERGLLVYVGVMTGDGPEQAEWVANKIQALRLFPDDNGKLNRSVKDIGGGLLLIPNFTLAASIASGTRPSFSSAAPPTEAQAIFDRLVEVCGRQVPVAIGAFGCDMQIEAVADGPVTIVIDREPSDR